jgi:hypothetical protein
MNEAQQVAAHIRNTIGTTIEPHPGGWPGQSEVALLDAVFSARANYGAPAADGRGATGVHRVLDHWRALRESVDLDDLATMVDTMDEIGLPALEAVNGQFAPGRHAEPLTKWRAVRSVAQSMTEAGYDSSGPIVEAARGSDASGLRRAFVESTPGVGKVTFDYFLVLLGVPGIKADTMIRAFVDEALRDGLAPGSGDESRVAAVRAGELLREAAHELDLDISALDHAIWLHQRTVRPSTR